MKGLISHRRQKRHLTPVWLTGHPPLICVASSTSVGISTINEVGSRKRSEAEEEEGRLWITHGGVTQWAVR